MCNSMSTEGARSAIVGRARRRGGGHQGSYHLLAPRPLTLEACAILPLLLSRCSSAANKVAIILRSSASSSFIRSRARCSALRSASRGASSIAASQKAGIHAAGNRTRFFVSAVQLLMRWTLMGCPKIWDVASAICWRLRGEPYRADDRGAQLRSGRLIVQGPDRRGGRGQC